MAAIVPRYLGRVRNLRLLSLPRKRLKRRQVDKSPNTIMAENGSQLMAENGNFLRTES